MVWLDAVACLNNIGPGLDLVGPTSNYFHFSDLSKIVLMLDMLLGRLDSLTFIKIPPFSQSKITCRGRIL